MATQTPITGETPALKRLVQVTILAWVSVIGLDFFLNAGLLARFYVSMFAHPCVLPPLKAFQYIPLGYAAFFLWCALLAWLILRTGATGVRACAIFGAQLGAAIAASGSLAMASILSVPHSLLLVWFLEQASMFCLAGAIVGSGLTASRLRPTVLRVLALFLACVFGCVAMQILGLAPPLQLQR